MVGNDHQACYTLQDINLKLGEKTVLKNLNLQIATQSFTAVLGKNGSGKTTLLKALCALLKPHAGSILLLNKNLNAYSYKERAQKIAWLPYTNNIAFGFRCRELIALGRYAQHQGFPRQEDYSAVDAVMADLGITEFAQRSVLSLSAGERQKVLIARALCAKTSAIILDEPCAHLDLHMAIDLLAYLRQRTLAGETIIFSIHDINLAKKFASHFVALGNSEILAAGECRKELDAGVVAKTLGVKTTAYGENGFLCF